MDVKDKIDFLNLVVSLLPHHFCNEVRHFIASQFALESNFGSSPSALCNHNYCGMKVPAIRLTLCLNPDEKGKFASFSGLTYCVHDYLLWLASMKFNRGELENLPLFVNHLKISGYCPEPDYIDKITSIYKQYFNP